MSTAPEMRAPADGARLDGLVGEHPATASQVAAHLELAAGGPVTLTVNSPGGSAFEGSAIYSELRAHPGRITVIVRGIAASAASLIAMAGDEIVMAEGAVMMLHNPSGATFGTADDHRETVEVLDKLSAEYAGIYAGRSGQPLAAVRRMMASETWFSAEEAVAAGFADRVEETEATEAVAAFNYRKFERAPETLVALCDRMGWAAARPEAVHADKGVSSMTTKTEDRAAPEKTVKLDPAAQAVLDEKARRTAIMSAANTAALPAVQIDEIVGGTTSPEAARAAALEAVIDARMADEPSPTIPRASVGWSGDAGEGLRERLIDGLRSRLNPQHTPEAGREFAHLSLAEMAAVTMRASGARNVGSREAISAMFKPQMASIGGAHTTSDFPLILSGVIGRELADQYERQAPQLLQASRELSAQDFRQRIRPKLSSGPELPRINETGEYTNANFVEDGEFSPTPATFGRIFSLSRQAAVNDDLSAFARIPQELAQGATATVRTELISVFVGSGGDGMTLRDGLAVFHASHNNLAGTPSALDLTSLGEAVVALRRQTGLVGEAIDLVPTLLIVPPELEIDAKKLVADISPTSATDANPLAGSLTVISEVGLASATGWYVSCDPLRSEALAHSYLQGQSVPEITEEIGFENDAFRWRVRLDFGASVVDHRPLWKNAGA